VPISETGRTEGFTLIEVLVVLLILSITVSLIAVNLARGEETILEDEARRVAALLQHARDEAVITGRSLGWRADATGHGFSPDQPPDTPLRRRAWPAQVAAAQLRIAGVPVAADTPLVFASSGIGLPFDLVLASGERRVVISGDGAGRIEVTK
jgi:general secretion pathway protein H